MTRAEVLSAAVAAVQHARTYCNDIEFSAEDASRSDVGYLCDVFEACIEAGARTINIADTVGYAMPQEWGELIARIQERLKPYAERYVFSVHCHNDLGQAVANSLTGVMNGARQVECTINGIGERAGNASLEEIIMALRTRADYFNANTHVQAQEIWRTSQLLAQITGINVQPNKAIVGSNAFAHESGIHQDGMIKNALTYEIMRPEDVGRCVDDLVLGKHSGRNALAARMRKFGFDLRGAVLDHFFAAFKTLADQKKSVRDEDLVALLAATRNSHQA